MLFILKLKTNLLKIKKINFHTNMQKQNVRVENTIS